MEHEPPNPGAAMKSMADELPPEFAAMISPVWRKNEADYWAARDGLLAEYRGRWVGFAGGRVVASGTIPVFVAHAAEEAADAPFVTCVGHEDEPERIRTVRAGYDTGYRGEPLPILTVEFRAAAGTPGVVLDRVIADTGADATTLSWADCRAAGLDRVPGRVGRMGGVGGGSVLSVVFNIWVQIDGREYPCRVHADFAGRERILGRDVLNRLRVLFDGPAGELVVSP
ncbi:MAG: hypothetical protein K2X82_28390 [Gemmataceae bacterium]|nr:hypothetical protein [Gemmataceae bacterium]